MSTIRRVVIATSSLSTGGGERVVAHLVRELNRRDIRATALCLESEGEVGADLRKDNLPIEVTGSSRSYDLDAAIKLVRSLRRLAPSVINVHDRASLPYIVLANLVSAQCPIIYTAHGLLFNAHNEPRGRHRLAMLGVSGATAVSEEVAARHAEYLRWRRSFAVIPNGVPEVMQRPHERAEVRRELNAATDDVVFLAVGNARPEKGFEDLMNAAACLRERGVRPRTRFWIAGKLSETSYCRALTDQREHLGLQDMVQFLGYRRDVQALYSAADAFVLSSRSEGLPMVLLEAMMAGLPVVATRVGGVPGAIPEAAGLLVDVASPQALGEAMARVSRDEALRVRLGAQARQHAAANFGVDRMADRYLETYARVLCGVRARGLLRA